MAAPTKEVLARFDQLIAQVPARVNGGSYNMAVDYKAAVVKAIKLRHKRGLSDHELIVAMNTLERFQ